MPDNKPYTRLRITSLKFISAVDRGAQGEVSNVALIKRAPHGDEFEAVCKVALASEVPFNGEPMGIVFGWALASTLDGGKTEHVDLQRDAVVGDDNLIKIAAAFMESGGLADTMHSNEDDGGRVVFMLPLTAEVLKALGLKSDVHGLAIGMKPSPETFKRFQSGELRGFSIAGTGIRETVEKTDTKCPSCSAYGAADSDGNCPKCGKAMKRADVSKTIREEDGKYVLYSADGEKKLSTHDTRGEAEAQERAIQANKSAPAPDIQAKAVSKQVVLTSIEDGHQHAVRLDDPADQWFGQKPTTSPAVSKGSEQPHSHDWIFDSVTGAITIAESAGHSHAVDAVVPADVLAQAALNESGERCSGCGEMCSDDARYCPKCGKAMSNDGTPKAAITDDNDRSGASVVVISARAPEPISTPSAVTPTVKSEDKEPPAMTTELNARIRDLEVQNAHLAKMASLTDAQRAYYNKCSAEDQATFINLTPAARQGVLDDIAKADTVVYTALNGREYRKSDDLRMIELAQATDAATKMAQKSEIEKRDMQFEKRGNETLPHFAKGVKGNLRGRIMKAIDLEFSDPAEHEEAVRCLKAADYAFGDMEKAKGVNPHLEPPAANVAQQEFEHKVNEFAKRNNLSYPEAFVRATATEPDIRKLYNEMQLGGN